MIRRSLALLALLPIATLASACGATKDSNPTPEDLRSKTTTEQAEETTTEEAPAPDPTIEPGTGIAGVEVGAAEADAVDLLGEPDTRRTRPNEISGTEDHELVWSDPELTVIAAPVPADGDAAGKVVEADAEITRVETTSPDIRTSDDLGVGTTRAELLEVYPDADCDGAEGEDGICRVGTGEAGDIVTDWFLSGGTVARVVVGRVID